MSNLYFSFKEAIQQIIDGHFPTAISLRFQLRTSSEIFIPDADVAVAKMKMDGNESIHILFDGTEIIEVPFHSKYEEIELWFLMAFRDAIKNGKINIEIIPEYLTTEQVRRNKIAIKNKKKKALEDAIKNAIANPMTDTEIANTMKYNAKKKARANADKEANDKLKRERALEKLQSIKNHNVQI